MTFEIGKNVPWNASWTGEMSHEVRPCKYAGGNLAIWQRFAPESGSPVFAKPHMVRQRKSVVEMRCTVCGERTTSEDRWWFPFGGWQDGWWFSTETPVHFKCAEIAQSACPAIKKTSTDPIKFPNGHTVLAAIVGGPDTERDFDVTIGSRRVVGHLKLGWRNPTFLKVPS